VPIHFVIADAIVSMEGNGPLAGASRRLDRIVLADDPVAADATCARLMGLMPERVPHICGTAMFLGNMPLDRIEQLAAPLTYPPASFQTEEEFGYLRARAGLAAAAVR
jgi:uncharacterized protein (DUF362 family)